MQQIASQSRASLQALHSEASNHKSPYPEEAPAGFEILGGSCNLSLQGEYNSIGWGCLRCTLTDRCTCRVLLRPISQKFWGYGGKDPETILSMHGSIEQEGLIVWKGQVRKVQRTPIQSCASPKAYYAAPHNLIRTYIYLYIHPYRFL